MSFVDLLLSEPLLRAVNEAGYREPTPIQTATIPDKGVWYRVRLGPYKDMDELNRTRDSLKQNGVEATPTRTQ